MKTGIGRGHEATNATLDGRVVSVSWMRVTEWTHDPSYGADADGNRGVPMDFYEDQEPEDVEIEDADSGDEIKFDGLTPGQKQAVLEAIDTYQSKHDAEGEIDEPEPPEEEAWEREERRRDDDRDRE